ncbi:hypothetical protein TNCV_2120431 [Trichonephila clavipes]|nr:hypothetical protein TNCV_2120431 [Trichonephila clavipes]
MTPELVLHSSDLHIMPTRNLSLNNGRGSLVIKVADSYQRVMSLRARIHSTHAMQKARMHIKYIEVQTFTRWCGLEVRRRLCRLSCPPRHMTKVQNYEICRHVSTYSLT